MKALKECETGSIRISAEKMELDQTIPLIAQVNSFGFTGSIATVILRESPERNIDGAVENVNQDWSCYLLPFSAKTSEALSAQISQIYDWAQKYKIDLRDAAALLSLNRDHLLSRRIIPVMKWDDLLPFTKDSTSTISKAVFDAGNSTVSAIGEDVFRRFLNIEIHGCDLQEDETELNFLLSEHRLMEAACFLYEHGYDLDFYALYNPQSVKSWLIRTMPTYPFQRRLCWRVSSDLLSTAEEVATDQRRKMRELEGVETTSNPEVNVETISDIIASILHISSSKITADTDIFDIGIDSLNSIELANNLMKSFGKRIDSQDLYRLLTIRSICDYINGRGTGLQLSSELSQSDLNDLIVSYSSQAVSNRPIKASVQTLAFPHTILLTGANGMLGSHVLYRLLKQLSIRVCCLVRGDPWSRILSSFNTWGLDTEMLHDARLTNRVVMLSTTSLSDTHLGCDKDDYNMLLDSVNEILHLAWKMDFNLPVTGFTSSMEGTKGLAEFSIQCRKLVRFHFVSSFSTSFGYEGDLVPERPLPAKSIYCLKQVCPILCDSIISHRLGFLIIMYRDTLTLNLLQNIVFIAF